VRHVAAWVRSNGFTACFKKPSLIIDTFVSTI
jgi:hypothetical protein